MEDVLPDGSKVWRATVSTEDDGQTVSFRGAITKASVDAVRRLTYGRTLRTLLIDSPGGEVDSAITLAYHVRAHGAELVVEGVCFSSCANYLFTGARSVKVKPKSLVALHGSIGSLYFRRNPVSEDTRVTIKTEQRFFEGIGFSVEPFFVWQRYAHAVQQSDVDKQLSGVKFGWAPTLAQWRAYGLKNIKEFWYPNTEADYKSLSGDTAKLASYIVFGDALTVLALRAELVRAMRSNENAITLEADR
jgi:hypothetical protein